MSYLFLPLGSDVITKTCCAVMRFGSWLPSHSPEIYVCPGMLPHLRPMTTRGMQITHARVQFAPANSKRDFPSRYDRVYPSAESLLS